MGEYIQFKAKGIIEKYLIICILHYITTLNGF